MRKLRRGQKTSSANDSANELLRSANSASGTARNAWLAYLVLNVYLLVTIAGVTHVDLLLNSTVTLPIVNVKIPLFGFFSVAPVLLLLVHLGFLVQHAMLAHKYDHFSKAVSDWESSKSSVHPSRRYVDGYVFSQMIAGPKPPKLLGTLIRLMVFVTFSLLPILILLYFQIKFLPYHEVGVTHVHRIAVFLDLVLLLSVRPYITISYLRPLGSKLQIGSKDWPWELSYWNLSVSIVVCLTVLIFSLFVATVPQGCINPFREHAEDCFSFDKMAAKWAPQMVADREVFVLTALLFEAKEDWNTSNTTRTALFARNLVVTDTDLVPDKDDKYEEVSVTLRDRDLRFAVLDRSDLHRADLSYANLKWSSLNGANLQGAVLVEAKLQGANLNRAVLTRANLNRANLQGANLHSAVLTRANLNGADLTRANLDGADLTGADLHWAKLLWVNLRHANLQGAVLTQANLKGANLDGSKLQGADLGAANLKGADLRRADLTGADLSSADLLWAGLHSANLQGADLSGANLQGANLIRANLQGALLRKTVIWQATPTDEINLEHTDLTGAEVTPLTDDGDKDLQILIDEEKDIFSRFVLKRWLVSLLTSESKNWLDSVNETWKLKLKEPSPDPIALSLFLANLVCDDGPDGYIAKAITKRTLANRYTADLVNFSRKVSNENCKGAKTLDDESKVKLCKLASWSGVDIKKSFCAQSLQW